MNTSEFVAKLDQQGVRLRTKRDKLIIHAPKGSLKGQLQDDLAVRKQEIIAFLRAREILYLQLGLGNCNYL